MKEFQRVAEFVHIPKTAGTSVRKAVEGTVGSDGVYIYSPQVDRLVQSSSNLLPQTSKNIEAVRLGIATPVIGEILLGIYPLINGVNKFRIKKSYPNLEIPDNTKVIFGHFSAGQFDDLLGEEPIRATVIRNPLDRTRSHYDHWKRNKGMADWGFDVPYESDTTFEDFALLPQVINYQDRSLSGKGVEQFDVVGVTEATDEFIDTFVDKLIQEGLAKPQHIVPQKRLNTTHTSQKTDTTFLDQDFIVSFKQAHSKDYELYGHAKEIYQSRASLRRS